MNEILIYALALLVLTPGAASANVSGKRAGFTGMICLKCEKSAAAQNLFPRLSGAYFGQKVPGDAPAPFADGIVGSTPVFTPDGMEIFWSRSEAGFKSTIMNSRLENGVWTPPRPVSFSKPEFMDHNPAISGDGRTMIFAASRPTEGRPRTFIENSPMPASDLWMSTRKDGRDWSEPVPLGPSINTEFDEDCPKIAADGTVYFTSGKPKNGGYTGICRTRFVEGRYADPEILPAPVNTKFGEIVEVIAPDQSYLLFRSMRPGGFGQADVYLSFSGSDGAWADPLNLGERFNKPRRWALAFSPDRRYLFFTSDGEGSARAYWVEAPRIENFKAK